MSVIVEPYESVTGLCYLIVESPDNDARAISLFPTEARQLVRLLTNLLETPEAKQALLADDQAILDRIRDNE